MFKLSISAWVLAILMFIAIELNLIESIGDEINYFPPRFYSWEHPITAFLLLAFFFLCGYVAAKYKKQ